MSEKWRTGHWRDEIQRVECERETEKSVWVKREYTHFGKKKTDVNRVLKKTEYDTYFDTWEDARDYLLKKYKDNVVWQKKKLESAIVDVLKIETLEKPLTNPQQ